MADGFTWTTSRRGTVWPADLYAGRVPVWYLGTGANWRLSDSVFELKDSMTDEWLPIWLTSAYGHVSIAVGAAGSVTSRNHRWYDNTLQILDVDTGSYHPLFVYGASPAFGIAVGAASATIVNTRLLGELMQLANTSTSTWHTPFIYGGALALGAEES